MTDREMGRLGVRMHGVTLVREASHAPFLAHAAEHLKPLVTDSMPNPDIFVRCLWSEGNWQPEVNPFPRNGNLNIVGNRMLGNAGELIWLDTLQKKGLQLRFRREERAFIFDVAYRLDQKDRADNRGDYEQKKCFGLMSELVYHPLFWYLQRHRGWTLLHAASLDTAQGGIVICGLAGVGKSTSSTALMSQAGARLMSENLVLTDGDFVYACQEPLRLDLGSLKMLGHDVPGLTRMPFPESMKEKTCLHLSDRNSPDKVKPIAVFLPQFSAERGVKRLEQEFAVEKIAALNSLVREVDEYHWYASALNMTWPTPGGARRSIENLERLTQTAACFDLRINRSAGVGAVVQDIVTTLHEITGHSLSKHQEVRSIERAHALTDR